MKTAIIANPRKTSTVTPLSRGPGCDRHYRP
jgi:hypothetical protein